MMDKTKHKTKHSARKKVVLFCTVCATILAFCFLLYKWRAVSNMAVERQMTDVSSNVNVLPTSLPVAAETSNTSADGMSMAQGKGSAIDKSGQEVKNISTSCNMDALERLLQTYDLIHNKGAYIEVSSLKERLSEVEKRLSDYSAYASMMILIDNIGGKILNNESVSKSITILANIASRHLGEEYSFKEFESVLSNIEIVEMYISAFKDVERKEAVLLSKEDSDREKKPREALRGGFPDRIGFAKDKIVYWFRKVFPEGSFGFRERQLEVKDVDTKIVDAVLQSNYAVALFLLEARMKSGAISNVAVLHSELKKKDNLQKQLGTLKACLLEKYISLADQ